MWWKIDYWDVVFSRYYWCEKYQKECNKYLKSYLRLKKEIVEC